MHLTCLSYRSHTIPWTNPRASFAAVTSLKIDAKLLFDGLFELDRPTDIFIALANLTSLSITHMHESAFRLVSLTQDRVELFFDFIMALTKLEELTIESFTLPMTPYPERRPFMQISIRKLTVIRTKGPNLSFLLQRFQPTELTLEGCTYISVIPHCTKLKLDGVPLRREGLSDVMWKWNGLELEIISSSFFDDSLIQALKNNMVARRRPVWPSLQRIRVRDCPHTDAHLRQMLDIRSQLALRMQPPAHRG